MRKNRSTALAAATFLIVSGAVIAAAPSAYAGVPGSTQASDRNSDFDGDGYEDVLVGAPGATVSGRSGAGLVTVQYGSARGIGTGDVARFSQSTSGVAGAAEAGDGFGRAVATGDLDGDGFDDAVVGIPGEDLGTVKDAGGVAILWGSKAGLKGTASDWLETQEPAAGERFGLGLAAARFTAETDGDLLAVLDGYDVELFAYDEAARASMRRETTRRLDTKSAEARPVAAKSLTTGDYDKNGFADLVVSGLSVGDEPGHGWSTYLSGNADGLTYERDLRGGPVAASGDINGDGYDDLVTGEPNSPYDQPGETTTGGLVGVRLGGPDGPAAEPDWWVQDSPGVPGVAEAGDGWGSDLSVADTDGDGYADVAIGAAGEDIGAVQDAGAVWVLRGSASGATSTGARSWDQNSADVPGAAEKGDKWGAQVRLTDPNGDGRFGLLAAAPGENTGDGHVWVLSAGAGGITASGSWTYNAASLGAPSVDALFGSAIDE
ncbi:FG-GAP-like repeat-containing protein [Streptomyces sp. DSM 3412]|uniref:FG-GAP-like repeat-containing protein n=1 Tax=Streptomyces gottesmaniae TaxID=3075518 RepID=A0ABU2YXZ3_9ACTN|nr:FG-GAP-like repeat-containing protein [Streptomyces sp. DSM 3412]MDT0569195.1 FG-GAP-like repeat-containing protein [Streptomyces sp. DSM 3412]